MSGRPDINDSAADSADFALRRLAMVEAQLVRRGVTDPAALDAFRAVPRERFVTPDQVARAYDDCALPIGHGQTISQPYMVALMTQELRPAAGHRVLEIGAGSGYQTAILAEMGLDVHTVERIPELAQRARETLESLGYDRVRFRVGDGTLGWPEEAPFDRIIVTAGAPRTPPALEAQLADRGRMVIPVGPVSAQECRLLVRHGERIETRDFCPCRFVKLIGEQGWCDGHTPLT